MSSRQNFRLKTPPHPFCEDTKKIVFGVFSFSEDIWSSGLKAQNPPPPPRWRHVFLFLNRGWLLSFLIFKVHALNNFISKIRNVISNFSCMFVIWIWNTNRHRARKRIRSFWPAIWYFIYQTMARHDGPLGQHSRGILINRRRPIPWRLRLVVSCWISSSGSVWGRASQRGPCFDDDYRFLGLLRPSRIVWSLYWEAWTYQRRTSYDGLKTNFIKKIFVGERDARNVLFDLEQVKLCAKSSRFPRAHWTHWKIDFE